MKPNASSRLVACFALSVAGVCGPRLAGAGAGPVESGVAAAPQRADAAIPTLDQGFVTPPRAARPYTYWMWLAEAPRECITRDLEEFHAKGIVGVLIYPSSMGPIWYPGHKVVLEGKEYRKVETAEYGGKSAGAGIKPMPSWSDEWRAAVRFAAKEANRIAFHTAALSPRITAKPGYTFWAGTHYEPGITWWNQTPAFNTYLSRCSYLLQQGLFAADALIYQGDKSGAGPALKTVLPTMGTGYDYDHCNTEVLLTRLGVKDGRIVLPDGMSYRVLVLPDSLPMQLPVLEKVASLLHAGATVVGPRPARMFGKPRQPGDNKKFDALVQRLWADATGQNAVENRRGSGRLVWGNTARQVLQELGVAPDFEYQGLSAAGTIDWIHRTMSDGAEIYFVASRWETPESVACSFRVSGKQPEIWNPVTGTIRDATAFRQENGRTIVPLEFEPCGSVFVIFRQPIGAKVNGTTARNSPALTPRLRLDGAWDVSFDPKWGGPAKVRFDQLTDWTGRAEDGIRFYSGTAIYRKTFPLSALPERGGQLMLDLGQVREDAEVRLNGHDLGVVWTRPARVNITSAVKVGANELEVSVVNLWPNRLIGDAALVPEKRFTETNMRKFVSTSPLLPSGLLGPVQLLVEDAAH